MSLSTNTLRPGSTAQRRLFGPWALRGAWLVALGVCVPFEWERVTELSEADAVWLQLTHWNVDTTPFLWLLLLAAPWLWWRRPVANSQAASLTVAATQATTLTDALDAGPTGVVEVHSRWRPLDWGLALCLACGSFGVDVAVSRTTVGPGTSAWGDLPPAYHDEYSYLFQAETFASGRTWFPSHPTVPEAFDQMHVLNEGRMASRYFPGAGLWLAPFVAAGVPHAAHWCAGALSAVCLFGAGRELRGRATGVAAALVFALSPGVVLFSNLYLAHHPTLLGLSLFLWAMVCVMRRPGMLSAFVAGCGLSLAMLCRPMSAAGLALPFGVWLLWSTGRGIRRSDSQRWARVWSCLVMGTVILAALIGLSLYSRSITGDPWVTPYQQYTDIYTPRHVYGFSNVERGEQRLGPKVIEAYDTWAVNLTPELACRNVVTRWLASWQWILGIVPLTAVTILFVSACGRLDARWRLVGAAILSIHLAHVPYWFTGILDWHYVFESVLPWSLLAGLVIAELPASVAAFGVRVQATGSARTWGDRSERGIRGSNPPLRAGQIPLRRLVPGCRVWLVSLLLAAMLPSYFVVEPFWSVSRAGQAIETMAFSQRKYERLRQRLQPLVAAAERAGQGVLVLVRTDPTEVHIDYVVNHPGLDDSLLMARLPRDEARVLALLAAFSERVVYVWEPQRLQLRRYSPRGGDLGGGEPGGG